MEKLNLTRKIKKACRDKGINIQQLAKSPKVDMSASGLYAALSNNSLKVSTLVAIAEELEIPAMEFVMEGNMPIEKEIMKLKNELEKTNESIKYLHEQLEDKKKMLELSEKMLTKNEYVINYLNDQANKIKSKYKEIQENFRNIDIIMEQDFDDGKKKTACEKRLKMLSKEFEAIRNKITEVISEEY